MICVGSKLLPGRKAVHTDAEGHKYYTAEEAWHALKVGRSTFEKMIADEKVQKYRRSRDRRYYYRVEDIEGLKKRPDRFYPADEPTKELAAIAS